MKKNSVPINLPLEFCLVVYYLLLIQYKIDLLLYSLRYKHRPEICFAYIIYAVKWFYHIIPYKNKRKAGHMPSLSLSGDYFWRLRIIAKISSARWLLGLAAATGVDVSSASNAGISSSVIAGASFATGAGAD